MKSAILDIRDSAFRWRLVAFLAMSNLRARYKRTVLGPLWLTIGTAIGVGGLSLLWGKLLGRPMGEFVPSLAAGLIIWQFLTGSVIDGVTSFSAQAAIIRNTVQPYFIHPMQVMAQQLINFLHNLPVFIVAAIALDVPFNLNSLAFLPCLLLLILNMSWIALLLGLLGARFRDLPFILGTVMSLLFLLSPVLYRPEYLPVNQAIVWLNPFSHFIELIREPMLGKPPPDFVVLTNLLLLVAGSGFTLWLFSRKRSRIAFWV